MAEYRISVDLAPLLAAVSEAELKVTQRVAQAVTATAQAAYERWADAIMKAPGVWAGEKHAYVESIKVRSISPYEAEIWSDYRHALAIETGRPAKDLKGMLNTSLKVRLTAKGKRYLVIPFRHNTPGNTAHAPAMPGNIYDIARDMRPTTIVGKGWRVSGTGASSVKTKSQYLVRTRRYSYGERLPPGLAPKLKPTHKTDVYAGMMRMQANTPGAKSSAYLTMRTMHEDSPGWVIPARPGLFLAQKVSEELQPLFEQALAEAVRGGL